MNSHDYKDPYEHISIYHVFLCIVGLFCVANVGQSFIYTLDIQVILSENDGLGRPKSQKRVLHSKYLVSITSLRR